VEFLSFGEGLAATLRFDEAAATARGRHGFAAVEGGDKGVGVCPFGEEGHMMLTLQVLRPGPGDPQGWTRTSQRRQQ